MNYSKYGISESYIPTVYHNKIVIDKTTATTINENLSQNPYINENKATVEVLLGPGAPGSPEGDGVVGQIDQAAPVGFLGNVSSGPAQTLVTVDYNIVFNVPSYADFVNLTKDDDFTKSFTLVSMLCWKDNSLPMTPVYTGESIVLIPGSDIANEIENLKKDTNTFNVKLGTLQEVFAKVAQDGLDLKNIDNFTRYRREFPDGRTYFQVPYKKKFIIPKDSTPYIHLASFMAVQDFQIDLDLNFGGFPIDDENITSVSAFEAYNLGEQTINFGPLSVDTLVYNDKPQTKGVFYTIAQNQSTFEGTPPPGLSDAENNVTSLFDLLREEKFNDLKGSPWLGAVHKHEGRYMAGSSHDFSQIQPFLDPNVVPNRKLIDLRPLREIKEQKINFTSLLKNIKTTKTNYFSDDSKTDLLEKLTVISDPLLSLKKPFYSDYGHVDGFFAVNYTNFLRKHSIFSSLIENNSSLVQNAVFNEIFQNNQFDIKIKVFRYDVKTHASKLIYDSSRADPGGTFSSNPSLNSQQYPGNKNNININLGYLNVVSMNKNAIELDTDMSKVEYYTFSDYDGQIDLEREYKYEIEIEMNDPLFTYLSEGIKAMDKAIRGDGKILGLEQILTMINTKTGKNNVVSGGQDFPYVKSNISSQTTNTIQNSTIIDAIRNYDSLNGVESISEGINPQLTALSDLFETPILYSLGSVSGDLIDGIIKVAYDILDIENAGNISIDLIQLLINTLSSIRDNLKNSINAISNVDITTQSFGYRAETVSPMNGNFDKRIIREKIRSDFKIAIPTSGFDYTEGFKEGDNDGTKQITVSNMQTGVSQYHSKYFNLNTPTQNGIAPNFLSIYQFSNIALEKDGVVLPKGLSTDSDLNTWSDILQFLLLFRQKNVSKITNKTTFTYEASTGTEFEVDINSGLNVEKNLPLLKSLDRSQKQLSSKGLSIPDQIPSNQQFYSLFDAEEKQTDENNSNTVVPSNNLRRNNLSRYFASYVNNATEVANKNQDKFLGGVDLTVDASGEIANIDQQTIPSIALVQYGNNITPINPTGYPAGQDIGVTFTQYYENNVWGSESKRLFLDKYAEFFFDFVNNVKIEYLSGFKSYSYEGIPIQVSALDAFNNISIDQYEWKTLTNDVVSSLNGLNDGAVLCKMVDYIPKAFEGLDIPLVQKLKYYKKYYKYFLIIGGNNKDLEVRPFGSTI